MNILILSDDAETSSRLEQDVLLSGALLFASGNLKEHVEVTNPYHHASYIYAEYNEKIFGKKTSDLLRKKALVSLCIDCDCVLSPDGDNPVSAVTDILGIPVFTKTEDIFKPLPSPVIETPSAMYCSGCELTGGNPGKKCDKATDKCLLYKSLNDAMQGVEKTSE